MRWLVLVVLVVGCEEHGKSPCGGDARCPEAGVPVFDASAAMCSPGGGCMQGPFCGGQCCGKGEQCVGGICRCGMQNACSNGDSCEHPGPIGGVVCGSVCCGGASPCPVAVSAPDSN